MNQTTYNIVSSSPLPAGINQIFKKLLLGGDGGIIFLKDGGEGRMSPYISTYTPLSKDPFLLPSIRCDDPGKTVSVITVKTFLTAF